MKKISGLSGLIAALLLQGCSSSHFIGQVARREILQQPDLQSAQVGISLYDPAATSYLYNYQGDKYFIPASNTKLFTLYAGMKYLGDSLIGMRYRETDTALFVMPSGDPTLLHPAFSKQPVIDLLKKTKKNIYLSDAGWKDRALGSGWAWDDYNDDYMPERSSLPVYGNVIRWVQDSASSSFFSIPEVDWEVRFTTDTARKTFFVERERNGNIFTITEGREKYKEQGVPFITNGIASALVLLKDTVGKNIFMASGQGLSGSKASSSALTVLHSQPTDSLFRPMMHRSDNFFAEQTLMMVSNERLGFMNDAKIIDVLLKNDLKELPQRPTWVDGSGLSRKDLFTPRDFVWLLDKMSRDFGLSRMKGILPTGGTGTLSNYYKQDSGYIFAKTGTLSGVVALSGYLLTRKGHLLIFSILVNNYNGSATAIRRRMERLIHTIRDKY